MTLLIREAEVRELLPMTEAVRLVREALAAQGELDGSSLPRRRLPLDPGVLNVMAASVPSARAAGLKSYSVCGGEARFLVALWDACDGQLLALIEADWLGRIRTGAATGVATELLTGPDASRLAVIGAGNQARTQVESIAAVRRLDHVTVFSRSQASRSELAAEIQDRMGIAASAADSAREAVRDANIVVTITNSAEPVLAGEWLPETCHINAAGANQIRRRELRSDVLGRAQVISVDSIEQAKLESGDLVIPVEEGLITWDSVVEIGHLVNRKAWERPRGITVFKSLGIAVEDVAVARFVYDQAIAHGAGETTTFGDVAR